MSVTEETLSLYGKPSGQVSEDYQSPDAYEGQGDTRVVRNLIFSYLAAVPGAAPGTYDLLPVDIRRDEEVTVEQIGLKALANGERDHAFYTTEELKRLRSTGSAAVPVSPEADISSMGPHELAEWLATSDPATGRAWTIDAVLEKVGDDKDLANRMLEAEHVRSDGDPRDGLVKGLTTIIERSP